MMPLARFVSGRHVTNVCDNVKSAIIRFVLFALKMTITDLTLELFVSTVFTKKNAPMMKWNFEE